MQDFNNIYIYCAPTVANSLHSEYHINLNPRLHSVRLVNEGYKMIVNEL